MSEDNNSSHDLGIEIGATQSGVFAKIRSRFASAADGLGANWFTKRGLATERQIALERAKTAAAIKFIDAAANLAVEELRVDPQFARQAIEVSFHGILKKQENKDAVVQLAADELKQLPPPVDDQTDTPDEIDCDWLNVFERHAESASSDRLRHLFGRILSGEIRKPGSFSLTTLRIVSELDHYTAQLFQKQCGLRLQDMLPDIKSRSFDEMLHLESAGLVSFGSGTLGGTATSDDQKKHNYFGETHVGAVLSRSPKQTLQIRCAFLTRAGVELASILPNNEVDAIRIIIKELASSLEFGAIYKLKGRQGNAHQMIKPPIEVVIEQLDPP